MKKWEHFTQEELQTFANESSDLKDFCLKIGYADRNSEAIKMIREQYPNFIFPYTASHNLENLLGKKFNRLTVIKRDLSKIGGNAYWICRCDCGNYTSVQAYDLKNNKVQSCGCLRNEKVREKRRNNLTNKRFGMLIAKEQVDSIREPSGTLRTAWRCICDCGNEVIVKTRELVSGDTRSCGCLSQSYGEYQIEQILKLNHITYQKQYTFPDLNSENNYPLRFDFAIFANNKLAYLIECQGQQHYMPVDLFNGEQGFLSLQRHDAQKKEYCKENHIILIEIDYYHNKEIGSEEVIKKEFLCQQ